MLTRLPSSRSPNRLYWPFRKTNNHNTGARSALIKSNWIKFGLEPKSKTLYSRSRER